MSDPTGTAGGTSGATPEKAESDLRLALLGGDKFQDRVKTLSDWHEANERSFEKLCIGKDAARALENAHNLEVRAKELETDAVEKHKNAVAALQTAEKQAAETTAAANALKAQAQEMLNNTQSKNADAVAALGRLHVAQQEAAAAKQAAERTQGLFSAKIERLHDELSKIKDA
jgi:hypothetical protein